MHGAKPPMAPDQQLYLVDRLLCRLAMSQARPLIAALPPERAQALREAAQTLEREYREVRRRMRALAVPVREVQRYMPQALWVDVAGLGGRLSTDAELDALGTDVAEVDWGDDDDDLEDETEEGLK